MKKNILFITATAFLLSDLSGCTLVNGLFLSEESRSLIGFWSGDTWTIDSEDTCYYDFRSDGTVFVTEWTEDLQSTNNFVAPNFFRYSFDGETLKFRQYFGICNVEFALEPDYSSTGTAYMMRVLSVGGTFEYSQVYEGNVLYMEMRTDYDEKSPAAGALPEGS